MDARIGEFTPDTRALFNCSFYLFAALVIFDQARIIKGVTAKLFYSYSAVWLMFFITEIVNVYQPLDIGFFGYWLAAPTFYYIIIKAVKKC